jgi:hypothetical protein
VKRGRPREGVRARVEAREGRDLGLALACEMEASGRGRVCERGRAEADPTADRGRAGWAGPFRGTVSLSVSVSRERTGGVLATAGRSGGGEIIVVTAVDAALRLARGGGEQRPARALDLAATMGRGGRGG